MTRVVVTTLFQLMPHAGAIDAVEHHVVLVEISTYAPRVGSDAMFVRCMLHPGLFQLTLPVWGATAKMRYSVHYTDNIPISPNIRISQSRQTWNTLLFSNFREIKIFDSCSNSTQIQGANIPGEG